jgi:hypothetical protein
LQIMLRSTENRPKQLGTGIVGNGFSRDRTLGRARFTAQSCPAMIGSNAKAGTVMEAVILSMPYTSRGRLWIDLSYWRCRGRSSLLESARDNPEFGMHPSHSSVCQVCVITRGPDCSKSRLTLEPAILHEDNTFMYS